MLSTLIRRPIARCFPSIVSKCVNKPTTLLPQYTWQCNDLRVRLATYYKRPERKKRGAGGGVLMAIGGLLLGGSIAGVIYFGSQYEDVDNQYEHVNIALAYLYRTRDTIKEYIQLFSDPIRPTLLPDPLSEPYYQPPYTLVLEMTDILVHPEYDRNTGWRFKKRPGVNALLSHCAPPLFEIVIFTSEGGLTAMPVLDKLDPDGYIMYRLFRDSTLYKNGHHIKDMTALNRDLSKVIVVDWDRNATQFNERNAIHLKKWDGDTSDRTLLDLIPFLQTIATSGVEDIRNVLDFYRNQGGDMLEAFKINKARLMEEEERRTKDGVKSSNIWSTAGFAGKFLGSRQTAELQQSEIDYDSNAVPSLPNPVSVADEVDDSSTKSPSSSWWPGWFSSSTVSNNSK